MRNKKMQTKKFAKGFTLLELLVVVLIIGILAAIALPQYRLAKDKAEFTKFQSLAMSLKDAYSEYVLVHNKGTNNFDDLSFSIPKDFTISYDDDDRYSCISNNEMFCCVSKFTDKLNNSATGIIDCGKKDLSFIYGLSLYNKSGTYTGRQYCLALPNNNRANKLCDSIGILASSSNIWTPSGHNNSYKYYRIK